MIESELLDDPRADPVAVGKELRDIARLNAWFGGTRAVVRELEPFFERSGRGTGNGKRETWTLLDIGTGLGDIPRAAVAAARRHGVELTPMGMDLSRTAARLARAGGLAVIVADGSWLPLGPRSVVVTLGAEGALVASAEGSVRVPSVKVEAVDTTGAGDAFTAALAGSKRSTASPGGRWCSRTCAGRARPWRACGRRRSALR